MPQSSALPRQQVAGKGLCCPSTQHNPGAIVTYNLGFKNPVSVQSSALLSSSHVLREVPGRGKRGYSHVQHPRVLALCGVQDPCECSELQNSVEGLSPKC